jgi:hypothetical protein
MKLSLLDIARPWTIVIRLNDLFVYSSTITDLQCLKAVVNANIIALLGDYACYSSWLDKTVHEHATADTNSLLLL